MKKALLCGVLVLGLVLNAGCSKKEEVQSTENSKPATEVENTETINEPVQEQAANHQQSEDPIQDVLNEAAVIDENLRELEKKEITLEPEKEGWEGQTLCLWSKEGKPVKLTATEADDIGKMDGLSSYYFKDGNLIFFKAPFSNHIFQDGKMILWMDENMNVLDIPEKNIKDAQKWTLEEVTRILDAFNKNK